MDASTLEMFPEFSAAATRAVTSEKFPEQEAIALICERLGRIFREHRDSPGRSASVDAIRVFGGSFGNCARSTISAAAGIAGTRPSRLIPPSNAAAVSAELRRQAARILARWNEAGSIMQQIATEGKIP